MASISSLLSSGGIIESSSDSSSHSTSLQFLIISPSSICANVIISLVCYLEDIAQGVYATAGRIAIASEYSCDVYANTLEKISSKTTLYEDIIFLVLGSYIMYPFK